MIAVSEEKAPGAELFAVRVFEDRLRTSVRALVAAIDWAAERRVPVEPEPGHGPGRARRDARGGGGGRGGWRRRKQTGSDGGRARCRRRLGW